MSNVFLHSARDQQICWADTLMLRARDIDLVEIAIHLSDRLLVFYFRADFLTRLAIVTLKAGFARQHFCAFLLTVSASADVTIRSFDPGLAVAERNLQFEVLFIGKYGQRVRQIACRVVVRIPDKCKFDWLALDLRQRTQKYDNRRNCQPHTFDHNNAL